VRSVLCTMHAARAVAHLLRLQSFYKGVRQQARMWADTKRQKLLAEGPSNRLNPLPTSPEPHRRNSNACEPLASCTLLSCRLPSPLLLTSLSCSTR